jgi:hypothetical protein
MNKQTFWIVWLPSLSRVALPRCYSRDIAEGLATDIASQHPDELVYVLKVERAFVSAKMQVVDFKEET